LDSDADGFSEEREVAPASDPNDPLSFPAVPALLGWLPMTLAALAATTRLVTHQRPRRGTRGLCPVPPKPL